MRSTYQVLVSQNLVTLVPVALVILGGFFVAVDRWKRHPGVSVSAAVGLGLILAAMLVSRLFPIWLAVRGLPIGQLQQATLIVGLVGNFAIAAGLGLLLRAAFGWRSNHSKTGRRDEV